MVCAFKRGSIERKKLGALGIVALAAVGWAASFLWPTLALGERVGREVSPARVLGVAWRKLDRIPYLNPTELFLNSGGFLIFRRDVPHPPYRDELRYSVTKIGAPELATVPVGLQMKLLGWASSRRMRLAFLQNQDVIVYEASPHTARRREVMRVNLPKGVRRPEVMGYALSPEGERLFIVDGLMGPYKTLYLGSRGNASVKVLARGVNAAPYVTWGGDGWVYFQSSFNGFQGPQIFRVNPATAHVEFVSPGALPLWHRGVLYFIFRERLFARNPSGHLTQLSHLQVQGFSLDGETVLAGYGGLEGGLYAGKVLPAELR